MADYEYPLAVVGSDFRVASSRIRSRLVLTDLEACALTEGLRRHQTDLGFADLNTCNRNEWIAAGSDPRWAAELLRSQMIARSGAGSWFQPYVYTGEAAARHLLRVAIGQESLVVGERQIAGQIHRALAQARERGTSARVLNGLGSVAGRLVKTCLGRGLIGDAAVGVHSLAVAYLLERLDRAHARSVAVIGLGRIGRRVLGLLTERGFSPLCLNRTVADLERGRVRSLDELGTVFGEVRAAVVCTGALEPVIRSSHFAGLAEELLLVDIGIPEQVDRRGLPPGVEVAGLDELTSFYRRSCPSAPKAGAAIDELLKNALVELRLFCEEPAFTRILDAVQQHHRQILEDEIPDLVRRRLDCLPPATRAAVEQDLRELVLDYTGQVYRTIREASLCLSEERCTRDP